MFIGPTFSYVAGLGTDQIAIQRLMAIKDSEGAKRAAIETGCWNGLITLVFAFTGVYIHAYYRGKGYDPAASDANSNKIMFTFLLEETAPGFVGIVSAAILGCTLSVMSGGLNAAATSLRNVVFCKYECLDGFVLAGLGDRRVWAGRFVWNGGSIDR